MKHFLRVCEKTLDAKTSDVKREVIKYNTEHKRSM